MSNIIFPENPQVNDETLINGVLYKFNGAAWVIAGTTDTTISSSFSIYEYLATAEQTEFSGVDSNGNTLKYDTALGTALPLVKVYLNGILLDHDTDFTATTGTSITLAAPTAENDIISIGAYRSSSIFQNSLQLADNQKMLFGDQFDLEIYHNGSNSIVDQVGTGNLLIQKDSVTVAEFTDSGIEVDNVNTNNISFAGTITGNLATLADGGEEFTTNTNDQILDSFDKTKYRTVKYLIQAISEGNIHSTELLVTHDNVSAYISEYGTILTGNSLIDISANVDATNVNITITPTNENTTVDFYKTLLVAREIFVIYGNLETQTGTEDLNEGSGVSDLNI